MDSYIFHNDNYSSDSAAFSNFMNENCLDPLMCDLSNLNLEDFNKCLRNNQQRGECPFKEDENYFMT